MIPRAELRALRAMHDAFIRGLAEADDEEELAALDVLAGALAGSVPDLLDEIERLSAGEPERMRVFKMDRMGGTA